MLIQDGGEVNRAHKVTMKEEKGQEGRVFFCSSRMVQKLLDENSDKCE